MVYTIIIFTVIILFALLFIIHGFQRYINSLYDKINLYRRLYSEYCKKYENCRMSNDLYVDEIRRLQEKLDNHMSGSVNQSQLIDAVKFAMKCSHPDNGGDSQKFMKFRALYDKLKRGD